VRRLDLPSRADLPRDLLAGLTVGASQVGNAMAYTILAGVPPVHGLYAAMVGTPAGALTASSQRMAIVPTAALCLAAGGALSGASVTVLDIYGSLFFAAGPKVKESLPAVGGARCAVVVLRLRGRGTLHSATIALIRDYAAELAAGGGRLYLAGVGQEMEDQLRRTGLLQTLGPDAVVPATDELYGSCEAAQRRGRTWLETHPDGRAVSADARRDEPHE
jgi:MFS superfamily sulfate permease-like transporter